MSELVIPNVEEVLRAHAKQLAQYVIEEVRALLRVEKDWYTVDELAQALGKSAFTIREKWCNARRIDAEKDPASGKWRIPGHEYTRLVKGGQPRKAT